jgi:positive regulator of sigma E activity
MRLQTPRVLLSRQNGQATVEYVMLLVTFLATAFLFNRLVQGAVYTIFKAVVESMMGPSV